MSNTISSPVVTAPAQVSRNLRWVPFYSLVEREVARFSKVLTQTVVTPFVSSLLYLLIFGVSLGSQVKMHGQHSYLAFLIPGLMMMSLLNNAFQNSSSSIVNAKFSGDLEDLRVSPLSEPQIVWAMSFGGLIRGVVVGLVTLGVGFGFYAATTGEFLAVAHPLFLLYFAVVGGLAFAKLGLSVAFWSQNFEHISAFGAFVLLPLTYLGGVFISIHNLHPLWQKLTYLNPLFYFINGARYGILGEADIDVGTCFVISAFSLLVFHIVALISVRKGSFSRW
jgi:ABC-2 type transport system permease protein